MKQNNSFTSFAVAAILVLTIASLLTSCSGVRYSYFNKQKVPYTAQEETKLAKVIPVKPFLTQSENEGREKISSVQYKDTKQKDAVQKDAVKKAVAPLKPGNIFNEINIAKLFPKTYQGTQSEKSTREMDRDLMIVLLIVLILLVIALLGDDLLWLLFLALLILLIYVLIKYLGVFN